MDLEQRAPALSNNVSSSQSRETEKLTASNIMPHLMNPRDRRNLASDIEGVALIDTAFVAGFGLIREIVWILASVRVRWAHVVLTAEQEEFALRDGNCFGSAVVAKRRRGICGWSAGPAEHVVVTQTGKVESARGEGQFAAASCEKKTSYQWKGMRRKSRNMNLRCASVNLLASGLPFSRGSLESGGRYWTQ